jgi:hypothetical protein
LPPPGLRLLLPPLPLLLLRMVLMAEGSKMLWKLHQRSSRNEAERHKSRGYVVVGSKTVLLQGMYSSVTVLRWLCRSDTH